MKRRVSAIVLAAGASRRMGTCKQLLPLGDSPVIIHALKAVLAAGVHEVVVVVGANGDAVASAVGHFPVRIVRNPVVEGEMADSVRAGLTSLDDGISGVMICLADQPLLDPETCRQLLHLHDQCPDEILIPVYSGKKGHPTIFPHRMLQPFLKSMTLRDVVHQHSRYVRLVNVADQGVTLDMDTLADYQATLDRFAHGITRASAGCSVATPCVQIRWDGSNP